MSFVNLRHMQTHFQAAITSEEGEVEGLRGPHALTAEQGLNIYRRMYRLRMIDSLEEDFGACAELLADEFAKLCLNYVGAQPSQSYTLAHLGRGFPEFMQQWVRENGRGEWLTELSYFEHALAEAYLAPAAKVIDQQWLGSLDPEALVGAKLGVAPSVNVFAFNWNIPKLYRDYLDDIELQEPPKVETFVVTYGDAHRVDYQVLDHPSYTLFQRLVARDSLEEAVAQISLTELDAPKVFRWFSQWLSLGLFHEIDVMDNTQSEDPLD